MDLLELRGIGSVTLILLRRIRVEVLCRLSRVLLISQAWLYQVRVILFLELIDNLVDGGSIR